MVYGVEVALDGCVWAFLGRLLDDGVGIALDGCVWVCMGDESLSQESLNSKIQLYILLLIYIAGFVPRGVSPPEK